MTDPIAVLEALDRDAASLDTLSKRIYEATDDLVEKEAAWETHLDQVTADLEEEFGAVGRKSVPEHTALSAARRADRKTWNEYKAAKRTLERLQSQLQAKRSAISGRQSELGALKEELAAGGFARGRGEPVYGARA